MFSLAAADFHPAANPPALGDDEIHLWFFPHWQKARDAAAAPAIRALLAAYLRVAPDALRIEHGEHGKPRLAGAGLEFNLSHTSAALLLGVSRRIALGVDLESAHRRTRSIPELARRWFAPSEADTLAALPDAEQQIAFLRLWTCKEAVLKCSGLGIGAGLDRVEFELSSQAQVRALRTRDAGDAWQLVALAPDAAHLGALAWRGQSVPIRAFVMQPIAAAAQSG